MWRTLSGANFKVIIAAEDRVSHGGTTWTSQSLSSSLRIADDRSRIAAFTLEASVGEQQRRSSVMRLYSYFVAICNL